MVGRPAWEKSRQGLPHSGFIPSSPQWSLSQLLSPAPGHESRHGLDSMEAKGCGCADPILFRDTETYLSYDFTYHRILFIFDFSTI